MKKNIFKSYMIRPIIQKVVTRILLVIVLCMLWDRFFNFDNYYNPLQLPLFICGFLLLAGAWFSYLKLDGMKVHYLGEDKTVNKKKKNRHKERSMVDFVDEKVVAYEELQADEQAMCNLISNLIPGILSILVSVIANIFI